MSAWIPITIAAAFMQTLRSALQKALKSRLSTLGATASRFVFALPLALLLGAGSWTLEDQPVLTLTPGFFTIVTIGALAQVLATALLIHLFSYRNFAVGTAFTKTEVIQTSLFGLILLGEGVSLVAVAAILVSLVGVLLISMPARPGKVAVFDQRALIGIASGSLFAVSAVCFRAGALSLGDESAFLRAVVTLAFALIVQASIMLAWLGARETGGITSLFGAWRIAALVGLAGGLASAGWFTAMTLENAAHVRAVGQVEVIFTLLASYLFFHERLTSREMAGLAVLTGGILGLVAGT